MNATAKMEAFAMSELANAHAHLDSWVNYAKSPAILATGAQTAQPNVPASMRMTATRALANVDASASPAPSAALHVHVPTMDLIARTNAIATRKWHAVNATMALVFAWTDSVAMTAPRKFVPKTDSVFSANRPVPAIPTAQNFAIHKLAFAFAKVATWEPVATLCALNTTMVSTALIVANAPSRMGPPVIRSMGNAFVRPDTRETDASKNVHPISTASNVLPDAIAKTGPVATFATAHAIALLAGADQVVLCLVGAKQQKMTANAATVKMVQAAIQ